MTVKIGDFVKAKCVNYEDSSVVGTCVGIDGENIEVESRYMSLAPEKCYLDGAAVIPVVARVTASRDPQWRHETELMPEPPVKGGFVENRSLKSFTTLLGGIAASTVVCVIDYAESEKVDISKVIAELRYIKNYIVTRPRQDLGGGMVAIGEGHFKYQFFIDVQIEGGITKDQVAQLRMLHLTIHSLRDLGLLNGSTNIKLRKA